MPTYQLLTDRTLAQSSAITPTTLIHIVYTGDPSQNPAGSSYKAELGQLTSLYSFTGGTVTGPTYFTNGLTANTFSATTYQNLPVSGLTAGSNVNISGSNGNYTISVTGGTQLTVKNTVYVSKNGNDSTGLVERLDKPFLTINAGLNAIRAAYPDTGRTPTNRVKVVVEDGYYNEGGQILIYPYIDFDLGNSIIDGSFSDYLMVATYTTNPNKDFTTKIFGNAKITQALGATIAVTNINTRLLIQCDTISSDLDDCVSISKGYCRVICNLMINNAPSNIFCHAIEMTAQSSDPCVLDVVNATITQSSTSNLASPIHFGNAGSTFSSPFNQTLNLYNCRVINTNPGSNSGQTSAITVGVTHDEPSGSTLNLYNTVIYSKFGYSIFVNSSASQAHLNVYYYNFNSLNNTPYIATVDANHTLNEYITTGRNVDPDVTPQVF